MHPGDVAKILVMSMCVVFLTLIAAHQIDAVDLFSKSYLEDGFCLTNRDLPNGGGVMGGHMIAFYWDALMVGAMAAIVHVGRNKLAMSEPALRPIEKNMFSLFGHSCGHLFLGLGAMTGGDAGQVFEGLSFPCQLLALVVLCPVWYGFSRDKTRSVAQAMTIAMCHNILQVFFLPTRFFFTHVLMAVLFGSGRRWLGRPAQEKTRFYTMEAWLVDVPILVMTYVEAIGCDAFLIDYGGHVYFDMVVPVMFIVYWVILVCEQDGLSKLLARKGSKKVATVGPIATELPTSSPLLPSRSCSFSS